MDTSYGVGITNRYALFIGEEEIDPFELLKTPVPEKKTDVKKTEKKDVKTKPADTKLPGKPVPAAGKPISEVQNKRPENKSATDKPERQGAPAGQENRPPRGRGRGTGTGPRFGGDRDREERNNRRNDEGRDDRPREYRERPAGGDEAEGNFGSGDGYRGRGRGGPRGAGGFGRGLARGARGGRPQDTRPRRDYDRQSGSDRTGVKPVEKKEGGGSHNWGSVNDDIEGQLENAPAENVWGEATEAGTTDAAVSAPVEGETPAETEETSDEPAIPEGPKELTLDEYKALIGQRKKPEYNLRKPGEGEDGGQWKKAVELKKKEIHDDDEEEEDTAEYLQRAGRQKHIEIDIRFADSRRGGSGGRGGPRGRGRGGPPRGDGENRDRGERVERGEREYDSERADRPPRGEGRGGYRGDSRGGRGEGRGGFRGGRGGPRVNGVSAPRVDDVLDFPALM